MIYVDPYVSARIKCPCADCEAKRKQPPVEAAPPSVEAEPRLLARIFAMVAGVFYREEAR
jgi:hypothetical protein